MRRSLPVIQQENGEASEPTRKKPEWLKIRPPTGEAYGNMKVRARRLKLATVCEEARCPNISECWSGGTATFMLMGEICTRGCRFCAVNTKKLPPALDKDEPANIAEAVDEMQLSYVVLTSVNRDELSDGGAGHLAECLNAIHDRSPDVLIEMQTPDFEGNRDVIKLVAETPISVFAHNIETVRRLTPTVRDPRADYDQSLEVLRYAKEVAPKKLTKSSIMTGLGETEDEVRETMADLRAVGVDVVTLGQYLRPSSKHLPVVEFMHPETFNRLADDARAMGFAYVASGPMVRSSYRAGELFLERKLRAEKRAAKDVHPRRPAG